MKMTEGVRSLRNKKKGGNSRSGGAEPTRTLVRAHLKRGHELRLRLRVHRRFFPNHVHSSGAKADVPSAVVLQADKAKGERHKNGDATRQRFKA